MKKALILLCLFAWIGVNAQSTLNDFLRQGRDAFDNKDYQTAYKYFNTYRLSKPLKEQDALSFGIAAFEVGELNKAIEQLSYNINTYKKVDAETYYYHALAQFHNGQYKDAAKSFKLVLKEQKLSTEEERQIFNLIRNCGYSLKSVAIESPSITQNLGEVINGPYDDFSPVFSPNFENIIYFSKVDDNNLGGKRDQEGLATENGEYKADIYRTEQLNGLWQSPTPLSGLINSAKEDIILDFNNAGNVMYFYSGFNRTCGEIRIDTFSTDPLEKPLFPAVYQGPVYAENCDADVSFLDDGNVLFYASNSMEGAGGYDLFYKVYQDTAWSQPINLGKEVNTAYDERYPFLANDGKTVYFSSNDPSKSYGGFDVFKAVFNPETKTFDAPINIGFGINSNGNEINFKLNQSGNSGFFASDRKKGFGGFDLYISYFKQNLPEQILSSNGKTFMDDYAAAKTINKELDNLGVATTGESEKLDIEYTQHVFINPKLPVYSGKNAAVLSQWFTILKSNPSVNLTIVGHAKPTNQGLYAIDLFTGYAFATQAKNYLVQKGNDGNRINIISAGSRFSYGDPSNPLYTKVANRAEAYFIENDPVTSRKVIPMEAGELERMTDKDRASNFRTDNAGLHFKVEVLVTDQLWNDPIMNQYERIYLEIDADEKKHYLIGDFDQLKLAEAFQKTLLDQNFKTALVVPYIDGFRLSSKHIYPLLEKYPVLNAFVSSGN